MNIDKLKVEKFANEISTQALNKVLSKDMNIHEVMCAVNLSLAEIVGTSMPAERFKKELDDSESLASIVILLLKDKIEEASAKGKPINITQVLLAFYMTLDYILDNIE